MCGYGCVDELGGGEDVGEQGGVVCCVMWVGNDFRFCGFFVFVFVGVFVDLCRCVLLF